MSCQATLQTHSVSLLMAGSSPSTLLPLGLLQYILQLRPANGLRLLSAPLGNRRPPAGPRHPRVPLR